MRAFSAGGAGFAWNHKEINAPRGTFGRQTLKLSTAGLSGDDATYATNQSQIAALTAQRNAIASQMLDMLEGAEFGGRPIDEFQAENLIRHAEELLEAVE